MKLPLDHNADLEARNIYGESPKEQVQKHHFNKAMPHLFDDDSFLFEHALQLSDIKAEGADHQETLWNSDAIAENLSRISRRDSHRFKTANGLS